MARRVSGWFRPVTKIRNPFKTPKQEDLPARRKPEFENMLCEAISKRVQVELCYERELITRCFEPYGVYKSTRDKILVAGTQIDNPNKPRDRFKPHNLEVGKISRLTLTSTVFTPDHRFDPTDSRYANGFICRI